MTTQHQQLLSVSGKKTESIKQGDTDSLSKLLMQERKHIQTINQLEIKRVQLVEKLFKELGIAGEEKTVTVMLDHLKDADQKLVLEQAIAKLVDEIVALRQVEQLNTELIQQSMEFVELSLDMLQPSMKNINYNEQKQSKETRNNSVFDSKA